MELSEQLFPVVFAVVGFGLLAFIVKQFGLLQEFLSLLVACCVFGMGILLYQIIDSHNDVQKIIDDYPYVLCEEVERPELYESCEKGELND